MKKQTTLAAVTAIAAITLAGQAFAFGGGMGGGAERGGSFGGHQGGSSLSRGSKGSTKGEGSQRRSEKGLNGKHLGNGKGSSKGQGGQHQGSGQGSRTASGSNGFNGSGPQASGTMGATNMPATMPSTSQGNPQMNNAPAMQGPMTGPGSQRNGNGPGTGTAPTTPTN